MSEQVGAGCAARRGIRRAALLFRSLSFALAASFAASNDVMAERPVAYVPGDEEIVETLPAGYESVSSTPTFERANRWLALAARSGDGRLAGRAETELQRLAPTSDVQRAQAWAAQHRHDFSTATRTLDALIAADARDVASRAMRAQIDVVQGRLREAKRRCAEMALLDVDTALRCTADVARRTGERDAARRALDRLLASATAPDVRRDLLVARAELGRLDADADFRDAIAIAPDDVRTIAAAARHWRATGRAAEVLVLVPADTPHTGLRLERVLASKSVGNPAWQAEASALESEWARIRQAGATPELRDEAAFHLFVREDAARALALARESWAEQRDTEDEAILLAAAAAANDTSVPDEIAQWRAAEGLTR
jgi:hypothetical protein